MMTIMYSVFLVAVFKLYLCVLFKYGILGPYFLLFSAKCLGLFQGEKTASTFKQKGYNYNHYPKLTIYFFCIPNS